MKKQYIFLIILVSVILGVFAGILITQNLEKPILIKENEISLTIPAVDSNGKGVTGELTTSIKKGSGLVLVNINNILAGYDTQYSARTAAHAANNYTNVSIENKDIIYSIKTNAQVIEGSSASSAFAIATIALLQDKKINSSVMITGVINEDGSISQVGSIPEKAKAGKEAGMKLFLIPNGNLKGNFEREKSCISNGNSEYCEIKYVQKINETEFGIQIKEVKNLEGALKYFYNEKI